MRKHILCLAGAALLVLWTSACSHDNKAAAENAANDWLRLVDSGNYQQSWDRAATVMKTGISEEQWQRIVEANRAPLGKLISRKLKSAETAAKLPGAPSGQYVVIEYESSFEHKNTVTETTAPILDKDGTWRVSLYVIQ